MIESIYNERFSDPASFTFFFVGNIDKKTAIPLFEKYLGSLPAKNSNETWTDLNIEYPKTRIEKVMEVELEIPKSSITELTSRRNQLNNRTLTG